MLFSCLYNAPVSYYSLLRKCTDNVILEVYDSYTKQTYRNRCTIMGANGLISLVIPVVKNHGKKTMVKDTRIDYDTHWNKIHWKSIFSAYSSAPFYEYYEEYFSPIYSKHYKFLVDFNLQLIYRTLEILTMNIDFRLTETYVQTIASIEDARESIHPKKSFHHADYSFQPVVYQQVFSDRHGFCPDLSIIDLLFNEGPNAGIILKDSLLKKQSK